MLGSNTLGTSLAATLRKESQNKRLDEAQTYIQTILDAITQAGATAETQSRLNAVIESDYRRAYGFDRTDSTQDRIDCALAVIDELEHFLKTDPVTGIHLAL